jgi:hypothetical protein
MNGNDITIEKLICKHDYKRHPAKDTRFTYQNYRDEGLREAYKCTKCGDIIYKEFD